VYALDLVSKLAEALCRLGVRRAVVVHGSDGLDEITISGATTIGTVSDGKVQISEITPEQFGLNRAPLAALVGGNAVQNAEIVRSIVAGETSPRRDVVLLNSAAALFAAGCAPSIADALPLATQSLDSGAAARKLQALIEFTNRVS